MTTFKFTYPLVDSQGEDQEESVVVGAHSLAVARMRAEEVFELPEGTKHDYTRRVVVEDVTDYGGLV